VFVPRRNTLEIKQLQNPLSKPVGDTGYQLQVDPRFRDRNRWGRTTVAPMVSPSEGNEVRRNGR
jgi:hypothetical protein